MAAELFNRNVFILGAGFSARAGAPLIRDFLDHSRELYQDPLSDLTDEERNRFNEVFEFKRRMGQCREKIEIDLDNIEQLFGLVDVSDRLGTTSPTARSSIVYLIAKTIQSAIANQKYYNAVGFTLAQNADIASLPKDWVRPNEGPRRCTADMYQIFAALLAGMLDSPVRRKARRNAVISFNYDLVLDCALRELGVEPFYGLSGESEDGTHPSVPVLKLHGSLNWAICQKCSSVAVVPAEATLGPAKIISKACPKCSSPYQPLLVPPSWDKTGYREVMQPVWKRAVEELNNASRICVIGYSMPETDAFFKYLLTLGLAENHQLHRLIAVDINQAVDEKYCQLLEGLFRERRYTFFGQGFEMFLASHQAYSLLGRGEFIEDQIHSYSLEKPRS